MAKPYNLYRCPDGHERRSYAAFGADATSAPPMQSTVWCVEKMADGSMCKERAVFVETRYGQQMNHAAIFYANDVEVARGTLVKRNDSLFTFKTAPFAEFSANSMARLTVAVHRHGTTPIVLDNCHITASGADDLVLMADQIIGDDADSDNIVSLL
jgi:hypothetical protein